MKKIGAIVAVLLVTAVSANAAITAGDVHLRINTMTGQAYVVSTTPETIPLVGIAIKAAAGKTILIADPGDYSPATHWVGVNNSVANGHAGDLALSGLSSAGGWGILVNTASQISEGKLSGTSSLVGFGTIAIGHITNSTVQSDFSTTAAFKWQYTDGTTKTMTNNTIEFVPEPATMSLLVIGGIATLIRRRR
ncbi:MAG: PEP-CTERM sorting domain-containing protein [Planctomycetota bacterium]|nr:PEP-CTERM sorting domain-containing protein [Planctomycetota bacterium]